MHFWPQPCNSPCHEHRHLKSPSGTSSTAWHPVPSSIWIFPFPRFACRYGTRWSLVEARLQVCIRKWSCWAPPRFAGWPAFRWTWVWLHLRVQELPHLQKMWFNLYSKRIWVFEWRRKMHIGTVDFFAIFFLNPLLALIGCKRNSKSVGQHITDWIIVADVVCSKQWSRALKNLCFFKVRMCTEGKSLEF